MTKVNVVDFDGGTAEQYDAATAELGDNATAAGQRFHIAGPTPTGWRTINCWEDEAAYEQFLERLRPILGRHFPRRPRRQILEVDSALDGRDGTPEVAVLGVFPGMTAGVFRDMAAKVMPGGELPEALLRHCNGPHPDGWYVVGLWTSDEERERFVAERVRPAVPPEALSGEPRNEVLPIHKAIIAPTHARA